MIEAELAAYQDDTGADQSDRPRIIVLNKVDVPAAREIAGQARQTFTDRGLAVYEVSAATRQGVRELAFALAAVVAEVRAAALPRSPAGWRSGRGREWPGLPRRSGPGRTPSWSGARSRGAGCCRPTSPTTRPVGYLADRLAKLGVEEALAEAGADDGAEVLIGNGDDAVVFDWAPDVTAGRRPGHGPRGTDRRLSP